MTPAKNPVDAWILKDGKRVLPSPTYSGAVKLVSFYKKTFPQNAWSVELAEKGKNPCGSIAKKRAKAKNPALLVMSNPTSSGLAAATKAYKNFHMVEPDNTTKAHIPVGWPTAYITIGFARAFHWTDQAGKQHRKSYPSGKVKVCTTPAMKDVFLFGQSLGVTPGTADRVDYDVPRHSGRNKWSKGWWHPHDSHPTVMVKDGKVRMHGPGLKVSKRGIIG